MNYAIISGNKVVNVIVWDGTTKWTPPNGSIAVQSTTAAIDDAYDTRTKKFTRPTWPQPLPVPVKPIAERLSELGITADELKIHLGIKQ